MSNARRQVNMSRANKIQKMILQSGQVSPGQLHNEPGIILIDLLANLRHWADANGIDYNAADKSASESHRIETINDSI